MRFVYLGILFFINYAIKAQSGIVYPGVFSSYFYNLQLINPSYVSKAGDVDLKSVYQFRTGLLSDVSNFAVTGEKTWRKVNKISHVGRLVFINEKEGPYISRPKAYANYALQLPLSGEASIRAGVALGASGVNFTAPSGSGSILLADGGVGAGLSYKKIDIGFSALQAFNSEGTVVSRAIRLQRYYNATLTAEKEISAFFDLKGFFLWRSYVKLSDQVNIAASVIYKKLYEAGAFYFINRGFSYFGAITLSPENNSLFLSLTYNSALFSTLPVWGNSFEIGLRYRINKG